MTLRPRLPGWLTDYLARFVGSRKWLLALGATVVLLRAERWQDAVAVVVAYLGIQGGTDALSAWQEARNATSDPDALVPGGEGD